MTLKALIVVGLANVTVAVTLGCANDRGRPTMTAVELLDRVGRLTALPGMNKVDVERILETRLTARTEESNRFFVIYRSENAPNAGGIIKSIEVREPTARGGGKGALLAIELESQGSLAAADVVRKLGQPGELRA